ncbi:MAG: condensation domain-containing protein, partial [Tumebacillaceae bacterium]
MNYLSKENVQEVLDLSLLQESIVLQESSQPEAGEHLSQVAYRLQNVDSTRFQQAWEQVIQSHPSLRVVFRVVRNRTVQVVLKTRPVPVEVLDLRGISEAEQQVAIEQKALAERVPFNVGEGPLMRLTLFVTGEDQALFVWTYHHLILDAHSQDLVFADLLTAYEALANGTEVPTTTRRPYKEYLTWVSRQDWMLSKAFWTEQLSAFEVATALLEDQRPTANRQAKAHVVTTRLSGALSQGLDALAKQHGVAGSTLAHAAWALLLGVYSGEESVTYGVTSLGRPSGVTGSEEMIGRFMNTLPAAVQVDGQKQLGAFLQGLHEQYNTLMEYAYLPLAEVRSYGGVSGEQELFASSVAV